MKFEIIGDPEPTWTSEPRELTSDEIMQIKAVNRIDGVRLHRAWTKSLLKVAVPIVDAIQSNPKVNKMPTPIDHTTAERLRDMLAAFQMKVYLATDIPDAVKERIVNDISADGFRLVDELEDVVR